MYLQVYIVINALEYKDGNSCRCFVICKINLDNACERVYFDYSKNITLIKL